jgi:hypothetical protein
MSSIEPFLNGGGHTPPAYHAPHAPDLVSQDLQRRAILITLATLVGVASGVVSLLLAGPEGALQWLGFLVVAAAVLILLSRHFEAGIVAFLGVGWIAIGTPTLAQGGSGGGAQALKISQAGLLVLLGFWALRIFFRQRADLYRAPVNKAILVYLVVCIWSTLNGILFPNEFVLANGPKQYVQVNILEILIRILALGGLIMIANTLRGRTLKAAAVMVVVPGVLTFTGLLSFLPKSLYLAFPQILAMAVLAAVALTGQSWTKPWVRVVCGVLSAAILGFYFIKGAEWVSGWLGALIAIGLICFNAKRKLFWAGVAVVAVIVMCNIPYFYNKIYKSNFYGAGPTTDRLRVGHTGTFTNDRTRMWEAAVRYANNFPLGIGLGNYRSYNKYFGRIDVWNTTTFTSAHGTYSQALSETGWLGLFAILWLVFTCGRMLRRYYLHLPPGWGKTFVLGAYGGAVGVFCASFNGDYLFPTYHNGGMGSFGACVYTWLLTGIAVAVAREYELDWATVSEREPDRVVVAPIYRHGPHAALPAPGPVYGETQS